MIKPPPIRSCEKCGEIIYPTIVLFNDGKDISWDYECDCEVVVE